MIYPTYIRQSLCDFLQPLKKGAKVLDIGSGTGILCEFSARCREDLQLEALDPARGMLKYAPSYVKTHEAYAEALPFESTLFDAILLGETLHHLNDVEKAIQEIRRVLRPDGRLYIYDFDPTEWIGNIIRKGELFLGEPGNFFKPEEIKVVLEKYGFSVEIKQYGYRYTVSARAV